ncbi:MAG: hypothetical protein GY749_17145 [Desulfobacteraceae bacterium]|nr:hypothetical protein [Desulfobacteraceae bacterium]
MFSEGMTVCPNANNTPLAPLRGGPPTHKCALSHSSLKEIKRDTEDKKDEYKGVGVKEYYIIDARGTETAFYRRDRHGNYKHIRPTKGGIIRSGILPGFQFRISDLYTRPSLEELAGDKVYHNYVFPSYKEVKQRAEQEKQRAEQEKQRFFETVRRMLANGLDITAVMKYTDLSVDEIAALSDGEKKVKGLPTK